MKNKNWISILIIALIVSALCCMTGCGTSSGSSNTAVEEDTEKSNEEEYEELEEKEEEPIDVSWYTENNTAICEGVYFVGQDMAADSYVLTCIDSSWALEVTVFENEQKYFDYHKTNRFTVGEENDAIEQNALLHTTLWPDEQYTLNLQDGYVLKLSNGNGTLVSADEPVELAKSNAGKKKNIMDGLYLSKDISRGSYMVTCTKTDYAIQVLVFKDKATYDEYMQADQYTVGKAQEAIEQYAMSEYYLYYGDTAYVNLKDEMIVNVNGGSGFMEPVSMSWAK